VTFEPDDNNVVDFIRLPVDHIENGITVASTDGMEPNPELEEDEEKDEEEKEVVEKNKKVSLSPNEEEKAQIS